MSADLADTDQPTIHFSAWQPEDEQDIAEWDTTVLDVATQRAWASTYEDQLYWMFHPGV